MTRAEAKAVRQRVEEALMEVSLLEEELKLKEIDGDKAEKHADQISKILIALFDLALSEFEKDDEESR